MSCYLLSNFCQKTIFFFNGVDLLPPIWTILINILFFFDVTPKCVYRMGGRFYRPSVTQQSIAFLKKGVISIDGIFYREKNNSKAPPKNLLLFYSLDKKISNFELAVWCFFPQILKNPIDVFAVLST